MKDGRWRGKKICEKPESVIQENCGHKKVSILISNIGSAFCSSADVLEIN